MQDAVDNPKGAILEFIAKVGKGKVKADFVASGVNANGPFMARARLLVAGDANGGGVMGVTEDTTKHVVVDADGWRELFVGEGEKQHK